LKRRFGAPIILASGGLFGVAPAPYLPVLRDLVVGLERDGATVVNRRDAARLGIIVTRDHPRVGWRMRFDRRTVPRLVVQLVVPYIFATAFFGYRFLW
jgi:hypothetical protein